MDEFGQMEINIMEVKDECDPLEVKDECDPLKVKKESNPLEIKDECDPLEVKDECEPLLVTTEHDPLAVCEDSGVQEFNDENLLEIKDISDNRYSTKHDATSIDTLVCLPVSLSS